MIKLSKSSKYIGMWTRAEAKYAPISGIWTSTLEAGPEQKPNTLLLLESGQVHWNVDQSRSQIRSYYWNLDKYIGMSTRAEAKYSSVLNSRASTHYIFEFIFPEARPY